MSDFFTVKFFKRVITFGVLAIIDDFHSVQSFLKTRFNYEAEIFRFPGGSLNSYNTASYDRIIPEMYRRGYTFYDWNVFSGDAS